MRLRSARFTHPVRTGPDSGHRRQEIDVEDDHFYAGVRGEDSFQYAKLDVCEIAPGVPGVRIWHPKPDQKTGEAMVELVPIYHVVGLEPMTEKEKARFYPKEFGKKDKKPAEAQGSLAGAAK